MSMEFLTALTFPIDFSPLGIDPLGSFVLNFGIVLAILLCAYAVRLQGGGHFVVISFLFLFVSVILFAVDNAAVFYFTWEIAGFFAWAIGQVAVDPRPNTSALPIHLAWGLSAVAMIFALFVLVTQSNSFDISAWSGDGVEWVSYLILASLLLKCSL
jgi:hypothetical protein